MTGDPRPAIGPRPDLWTHHVQYWRRGQWQDGFLAYTPTEARGVAREARRRGERVRVRSLIPA